MDDAERLWLEAAARAQAGEDADVRADARDLFVAEAARCRLVDRTGPARLRLACGVTLIGDLRPQARVSGHLALVDGDGRCHQVAEWAVLAVAGSRPALRDEAEARLPSLGQWLREAWTDGDPVRALDGMGGWHEGSASFVGADHAVVDGRHGPVVLPWRSVQAWSR